MSKRSVNPAVAWKNNHTAVAAHEYEKPVLFLIYQSSNKYANSLLLIKLVLGRNNTTFRAFIGFWRELMLQEARNHFCSARMI